MAPCSGLFACAGLLLQIDFGFPSGLHTSTGLHTSIQTCWDKDTGRSLCLPHPCSGKVMPSMYIPASSPASFFLSRLELRLRKPSLKLRQVAPDKTTSSRAKPERSAAAAADTAAGVPQVSRACRGKVNGDRVSWCIRDWAAVAAGKGTSTPASALCQALVELDKTLAMVESTSVKYSADDQFYSLVSLCDVVTRGILLCLEDTASAAGGRYSRSLETLRGLVVKAKQVAGRLGAKGRLGLRSRKKHLHVNLERDLEAVSDAVYRFAASHKPELATDEHHYVSSSYIPFEAYCCCKYSEFLVVFAGVVTSWVPKTNSLTQLEPGGL